MPFNGSGVYAAPASPGGFKPAVAGQLGQPNDWNALLTDIESALSTMVCRDGQSVITGDIAMGGHKLTGLSDGVGDTDSVSKKQMSDAIGVAIPPGTIWDTVATTAPAGWILAWGTIGNAASGATNRANADTLALFTAMWAWPDAQAPVSGGRRRERCG